MFAKLAVIYFCLLQMSHGLPLETAVAEYDVQNFFSSRIVGGVDAPHGHAPYMVALLKRGYSFAMMVCGGSIITPRHVLTAAHCVEPFSHWGQLSPNFIGVIGTNYWNSTYTEIHFSGYVIHPEWDWATLKNDIGIVITDKKIQFNRLISAVGLGFDWVSGGQLASVTGWGRLEAWGDIPYRLQVLNVTILTPEKCYRLMREASQILGPAPPVDHKLEICTLHSRGHGMCNGDSGSPVYLPCSNKQVGLVSWGYPCAHGAPDVSARLSAFKGFIESVTGIHF